MTSFIAVLFTNIRVISFLLVAERR